jgi:electron transfer flavoprotein alpha subunit
VTLRIAVLVKQIPAVAEMRLGADGRLERTGLHTEMNAYCRRAVAKGVELAAVHGGECVVFTLGPESAEDTLREALAWADRHCAQMRAVHACDTAFAGSDTFATATALAALLRSEGQFDLILTGRSSLDADTGQVGPQLAELLDLPFATAVREMTVDVPTASIDVRCELDDGWLSARVALPAVLSTAERLIDPCKMDPAAREAITVQRIRRVTAAMLGARPWGVAASPSTVGRTRVHHVARARKLLGGPLEVQVQQAVSLLIERRALDDSGGSTALAKVPDRVSAPSSTTVAVVVEPDRDRLARELLNAATHLARKLNAQVTAIGPALVGPDWLGSWGADHAVHLTGSTVEEEIAAGITQWARIAKPSIVLAPGTAWGREIASRVAAAHGAGLVGDAVAVEIEDGRLVAWKPAFGGQLLASITVATPMQMATVRAGALPVAYPRMTCATLRHEELSTRSRVTVLSRTRDDDLDVLAEALTVVGIGAGVAADDRDLLAPLLNVLNAELAATRKVTDRGDLPRARQIGITGRSIAPRLFVSLGASGKLNHTIGIRQAGTVLAINSDPSVPVFDAADIGLVADWREAIDPLVSALQATGINR